VLALDALLKVDRPAFLGNPEFRHCALRTLLPV
jgi:hypothetical protein